MKSVADEVLKLCCRPSLTNSLTLSKTSSQFAKCGGRGCALLLQYLALASIEVTQPKPLTTDLEEAFEERAFGGQMRDVDAPWARHGCVVVHHGVGHLVRLG